MIEQKTKGVGIEMVDCFFCGKKDAVKFIDGKGYVVLGGDGNNFGTHAGCDNCFPKQKAPSPENA